MSIEIALTGNGAAPAVTNPACDQARILKVANADREIQPVLNLRSRNRSEMAMSTDTSEKRLKNAGSSGMTCMRPNAADRVTRNTPDGAAWRRTDARLGGIEIGD